jgi:hypothetical protein
MLGRLSKGVLIASLESEDLKANCSKPRCFDGSSRSEQDVWFMFHIASLLVGLRGSTKLAKCQRVTESS